jgi:hypothetical protein
VGEFAAFFRAVHILDPPAVFVALAAGAGPREVQESLSQIAIDPGAAVRNRLAREFRQAVYVPVGDMQMATLATLAERHAEPEIAIHIAAFTPDGPLVEWFDAPDDPIAVSSSVPREAVSRFAQGLGVTSEWVGREQPGT